jgi:hydrogenase-1 operon protein HyaF
MSGLKDIGVKVVDSLGAANAHAVLREIESLLEQLVATGESGVIDLKGLPMSPADFEVLAGVLGSGEVSATIDAGGESSVRETAFHGVWWVTHRNEDGNVAAEFIEVTRVPEILASQPEDMEAGLMRLRSVLATSWGTS